jgi:predicted permease
MMNPYLGGRMPLLLLVLVVLWTLFWKGYAVWTAVKNNQKGWFVAVLVFNTLGILEIIYLFCVAKKKWSDVKKVFLGIVMPKKNPKTEKEESPKEETN